MWWWLIPSILLFISLLVSLFIVFKKLSQLRILDVEALPEEKMHGVKATLFQKRMERATKERFSFLLKIFSFFWREVSRNGRRLVQKVYVIEQKYRKLQKGEANDQPADPEAVRKLMDEAAALIKDEEYFEAEKRLIEVISRHPKHIKAYENLGHLYVLDRKYEQARETLNFALKINPDDASVCVALGELENILGNTAAAFQEFTKAIALRPNNPRYLDFFIEAAILEKNKIEANRGLEKLQEVNPENQKIVSFTERIVAL